MNVVSSQQDALEMRLKQLGAEVQSIHGILCYVKFDIENMEVSYVYNINAKNQYYLQRVRPYPIVAGVFPTQKEIVKFIKWDMQQFRNASKSRVFNKFIEVNKKLHLTMLSIEDLFLTHNVPVERMEQIEQLLNDIEKVVNETRQSSSKIDI
jgi:hypothetical protein